MKPALLALALFVASPLAAQKPRPAPRAFSLFSSPLSSKALTANRVFCSLNNVGDLCVDLLGSPVVGGGFWPRGTPDQYIFKSGLQVAGIIPATAGFAWAGDTVGAYFTDGRGTQVAGDPLTAVFDSRDSIDLATWPNAGIVQDTSMFASTYLGRKAVSEQDLWTRYWDGNPRFLNGRTHPAGLLIDQRALVWKYPEGNQDIVYFVFTMYNITARSASVYSNPELAAIGARFQDSSETQLSVAIPDGGYAIDSLYVQMYMDADVGDAGSNYGTAVLPLGTAIGYKSDFSEPNWTFPPEIYGRRPFAPAPGLVGATFVGRDVAVFTTYTGSPTGYPDPIGVVQLWRYLSGNGSTGAGDSPCTRNPKVDHVCFLDQFRNDERVSISIPLSTLAPGEAKTFVLAYTFAAPLDTVNAYVGGDLPPGIPFIGDSIAADTTRLRAIDRIAGWVTQNDASANGRIEADEVTTVPQSLLGKVQLAQAIVRNKFVLPAPPEPPTFFVIPGDNQVSVVWQPSGTEVVKPGGGDPYFPLTQDPLSPSYDPNYRQYDVEGYRIYRGTRPDRLEVVAQFDYDGTSLVDYTGAWGYPGRCAPELGIQDDCPVTFPDPPNPGVSFDHPLAGEIVQVPAGGRIHTDNDLVSIIRADTAVTGNNSGFPRLTDTGVLFTFVDQGVRNSFRYFYAVTAFDVNSLRSGPSSLESPRFVKIVTPRKPASNSLAPILVSGPRADDGAVLDATRPFPTIDSATGTFTGLIPPANDGQFSIAGLVPEAMAAGDVSVVIDSMQPGFADGIGIGPTLYVAVVSGADTIRKAIPLPMPAFNESRNGTRQYGFQQSIVRYDSAATRRFGIQLTQDARMPLGYAAKTTSIAATSVGIAVTAGRYDVGGEASRYLAHSRWYDEGSTEPADPTIVAYADRSHNAGTLTGVDSIWAPASYRDRVSLVGSNADGPGPFGATNLNLRGYSFGQTAWYPADFVVTWNGDSSVTVRDSTHRLMLRYAPHGGTGWGFVNARAFTAAGLNADSGVTNTIFDGTGTPNIGVVGYHHLYGVPPTCYPDWWAIPCITLERTAQYQPLDFNWNGAPDGSGIALVINGEAFLMKMPGIPAANTRWHLKAVTGAITATCTPGRGPVMTDCTGYTFTAPLVRPSYAPGLRYAVTVQRAYTVDSTVSGSLARVHTVPDPLYVASGYELSPDTAALKFVNLPSRAIIRIYSVSGILVAAVIHNDPSGGGEETWNLRSRTGRRVASGVYFYHVEGPDGHTKVGRFTVIIGPGRGS